MSWRETLSGVNLGTLHTIFIHKNPYNTLKGKGKSRNPNRAYLIHVFSPACINPVCVLLLFLFGIIMTLC